MLYIRHKYVNKEAGNVDSETLKKVHHKNIIKKSKSKKPRLPI